MSTEAGVDGLTRAETLRYARHLVLPEIGPAGQARLKAARVLVVGAGGLGSPVSLYLAAAGVGTLGLVDFDEVDVTNLHRQVLYGEADIGRPKLEAAAARLRDLNPHIDVVTHEARLTSGNALEILGGYDIVVDGTDNFPTRYLVNDACVLLGKRNVYGSILKFEGQVSVFGGGDDAPCYRCLFRQPPPPGLVPSCAEGGVLGVLPGIIGSLQALETIKLITGVGDPLIGRLLLFDAAALKFRELKLRRNPGCPVCGDQPTVTELIDYEEFCGMTPNSNSNSDPELITVDEIGAAELKERLDRGDAIDLIDVREPFEWGMANLEEYGARLIPMNQIPGRVDELNAAREIVLICRSGSRSMQVTQYLRQHGFDRARNLRGGVLAWSEEVDPSFPKY